MPAAVIIAAPLALGLARLPRPARPRQNPPPYRKDRPVTAITTPASRHLRALEAEAIHVIREVAAERERPALLFCGGKDSIVLVRLAQKAFAPGARAVPAAARRHRPQLPRGDRVPRPAGRRDRPEAARGQRAGVDRRRPRARGDRPARVAQPPADGRRCSTRSPSTSSTPASAAPAATRSARAPRSACSACATTSASGTRAASGPELWDLYNARVRRGEHLRAFPISNWTELDVWQYIASEELELPPIYMAHEREVFARDGMLYAVSPFIDADRRRGRRSRASVRYRTVGRHELHGRGALDAPARCPRSWPRSRPRTSPSAARRAPTIAPPRPRWKTASARAISSAWTSPPRHRRQRRRRQVDPDRAAALRLQGRARRPARRTCASAASDGLDLALLTDGLRAEREQGITIDVAYRSFATPRRRFILADCPGHAQYTRNMVTGASTADLALLLVDARAGLTEQSRRHATIAALLRIKHVIVAVNKMDLVDYAEDALRRRRARSARARRRGSACTRSSSSRSARCKGDNVVERSANMPWYDGPAAARAPGDDPGRAAGRPRRPAAGTARAARRRRRALGRRPARGGHAAARRRGRRAPLRHPHPGGRGPRRRRAGRVGQRTAVASRSGSRTRSTSRAAS